MPHRARNRAHWNHIAGSYQRRHAGQFSVTEVRWGAWAIPESQVGVLGVVAGLDVLELGCGAAHLCGALTALGARVTGIDFSENQLERAREVVAGLGVVLVEGDAEATPFPDSCFDLVVADHGAPTFCDPSRLLPEVARILRPGARFVFNMTTPLLDGCWDGKKVGEQLVTPWFGMRSFPTESEVSFQLSYGGWVRALVAANFVIEDLIELRPPVDPVTTFENFASPSWARRWPAEHIWKVRRR